MFNILRNAWKTPDLRRKILFTIMIIVWFRIGSVIPVPFVNVDMLASMFSNMNAGGMILQYLDTISGGALSHATVLALGIGPYITSSIVMQLMGVAIPYLEKLQKEGEEGRKKLTAITRYLTIFLGILQGFLYYILLSRSGMITYRSGFEGVFAAVSIITTLTAGAALTMWLGEQINEKGIGNGVSILLFAGIIARMPTLISQMSSYFMLAVNDPANSSKYFYIVPLFVIMFIFLVWIIVINNDAERRVPVQYAKRVVGRKMYAGQSSHIPLKIGIAGVMPVIFASTILQIPSFIRVGVGDALPSWLRTAFDSLVIGGWVYNLLYFLFIIMFAYFYVAITYNPIEIANRLRQENGAIPGIRPGKPTSEFFARVISKITFIGALFLALIAMLPMGFTGLTGVKILSLSGTSIIIVVGVAIETVKQMESQLMMRHYKGFLD